MQTNTCKDITIETFQGLILDWAKEKGILDNSTADRQILKTIEEVMETRQAFGMLQEDPSNKLAAEELVDGVGDVLVTLVILAELLNREILGFDYRIPSCLNRIHESRHVLKGDAKLYLSALDSEAWKIQRELSRGGAKYARAFNLSLWKILSNLYFFSVKMDLDLLECGMVAYRVISKRTGKMVDGIFVKDSK